MTNTLIRIFAKDGEDINSTKVLQRFGVFSGFMGIFLNVILFLMKLVLSLITSSVSIAADVFNNLSDAASSVVTLIGFKAAGKSADRGHPFSHACADPFRFGRVYGSHSNGI